MAPGAKTNFWEGTTNKTSKWQIINNEFIVYAWKRGNNIQCKISQKFENKHSQIMNIMKILHVF